MNSDRTFRRRNFIQSSAISMVSLLWAAGRREGLPVNQDKASYSSTQMDSQKLGVALVGLGNYSENELAPALQKTRLCRLAGIVTGSPDKIGKWQKKYQIPDQNVYSYENFDAIADNEDIDIVYVVLPNSMHHEYTIRAAKAGKHVICEKPMAVSVAEAEEMIAACGRAGKLLSIGYRMHYDPSTHLIEQMSRHRTLGELTSIQAFDSQKMEKGQWRLDKALAGGGPLMDLGIYCVQACIYSAGEIPVSVTARFGEIDDSEKFSSVEQSVDFEMKFPSGLIARCQTSYAENKNRLRIESEQGWMEFSPAFSYSGLKGQSSNGKIKLPEVNQQALQMDDFARCVKQGKAGKVSGEMGLRDVKILMAIYEAARTSKEVAIRI